MSAQSSYKPSDMIQSMEVKISTFTQKFSQTEINNLALGKNNQIRFTNQEMINRLRNSNLSSLTPSIEITPKYTTLNQHSSDGAGISQTNTNTYTYGTSNVLIDPGNGSNLGLDGTGSAYIYMGGTYASWLTIVNNILTNSFITVNSGYPPPTSQLTQNNAWLPNQYGSGPSYWYNCSLWTGDYICQQIIVYAALYAYISTIIQGQPTIAQASLSLMTNAVGPMYSPPGPPYNVGSIVFSTAWPFQLNNLSIQTYSNQEPTQFTVPYSSSGGNLPPGLSGLTSLGVDDMLNIFQINMPQAIGSNGSSVGNYSSNPTGIVSLTSSGDESAIVMNFTATGTTSVTINNVSFNVTIPSYPLTLSSWYYPNGSDTPTFTSTQPIGGGSFGEWPDYLWGQWNLNTREPEFNPVIPTAIQNALLVTFTSSNPLLSVVDYNSIIPDAAGQYVSVNGDNNGQSSTITATYTLFGQTVATYSYYYTFTLPSTDPNPPGPSW